jgi:hypothetical protein
MRKTVFLIALAVGLAQATGDNGRPPNRPPRAAKPKAVDLDLTLDFADEDYYPSAAPHSASAPAKDASYAWVYWTVGAATVAAGGLGWYLHDRQDAKPGVTRSEQVFTDER